MAKTTRFINLGCTLYNMSDPMNDPIIKAIKARVDGELLRFVLGHKEELVTQARADMDSEVPTVPLFEEYLTGLEHELKEEVTNKGYFPTTASRITQEYRDMFYYSSLPSLMEASC